MLKTVASTLKTKAQDSDNRNNIMELIDKGPHTISLIDKGHPTKLIEIRRNTIDQTNGATKRAGTSWAIARRWTIKSTVPYRRSTTSYIVSKIQFELSRRTILHLFIYQLIIKSLVLLHFSIISELDVFGCLDGLLYLNFRLLHIIHHALEHVFLFCRFWWGLLFTFVLF